MIRDGDAILLDGAGDGNRTHAICLGSKSSAIELHPRDSDFSRQPGALTGFYAQCMAQPPEMVCRFKSPRRETVR